MPRPDMSEERTKQILDAAKIVFARKGFDQATMDEIAEEAGLSKGALYLYFKQGKDAIISAMLKFLFRQEMRLLRRLIQDEGSVTGQFLEITDHLVETMAQFRVALPVAFEFYAIAGRRKEVRQFLAEYFLEYRTVMAAMIQRGIAQGEFRPVDIDAFAVMLIALFEGSMILWLVDTDTVKWRQQTKFAVRFFLDGLTPLHE